MKSSVELWDRANSLADNNRTTEGCVKNEDLYIALNLVFGMLKVVTDTMNMLMRDPESMSRSTTISMLDTLMEEVDEKLSILEALPQKQDVPV